MFKYFMKLLYAYKLKMDRKISKVDVCWLGEFFKSDLFFIFFDDAGSLNAAISKQNTGLAAAWCTSA